MANTIDNRSGNQKQPIRLRPVTETAIGTTAFFRNRPLVDTILNALAQEDKKEVKILFHGCSIGAETYSFIVQYLRNSCDHLFNIICHATDKEHSFIEFAKYAVYPKEILEGMSEDERLFFHHLDTHNVTVSEKVTRYAAFLDACKAETFTTTGIYDVVFLLNLLVYVPTSYQSTIIDKIARYNSEWLIITAIHMESIKDDLMRNGYFPYTKNIEEIHESWLDRRVKTNGNEIRPGIYARWSLPKFSKISDYGYLYCALFRKQ